MQHAQSNSRQSQKRFETLHDVAKLSDKKLQGLESQTALDVKEIANVALLLKDLRLNFLRVTVENGGPCKRLAPLEGKARWLVASTKNP